ncbi:MAG: HAD family hydrolase [Coprobacillus sp.]|nr:HAD family hydrolase [Coprobacillus sp.]
MKKKTIFFDLDGTLVDTLKDLRSAVNYSLREHGYEEKTLPEIKSYVGNGVAKLVARCLPNQEENPDYQDCLDVFSHYYENHYLEETGPYKGDVKLVKKLKRDGYNLVIISNKLVQVTENIVNTLFPNMFDDIEGDRKGQNNKPAPDMINRAVKTLKIDLKDCIVVGDSNVDFEMGNNVGCPTILVTWGFRDKESLSKLGAYAVVDNTKQLYKTIKNWSKNA